MRYGVPTDVLFIKCINFKSQRDGVVNYIKNQKEHHQKKSFRNEYLEFLNKFDVNFNQKYVFEFYDDKAD